MRQSLGTAGSYGMIGVTIFGLIFTPVFYVVVREFRSQTACPWLAAGCPRRLKRPQQRRTRATEDLARDGSVKINCTAMAASSTPNTRTTTLRAVSPIRWWISWAAPKDQRGPASPLGSRAPRQRAASGRPCSCAASTMAEVMAPGPASSGVASGNTVISACCSALLSASSLSLGVSRAEGSTASCRAQ